MLVRSRMSRTRRNLFKMVARSVVALLAVLWCASCAQARRKGRLQVRLEGGSQPHAGRVMVYYNKMWGGICENGWTKENAAVVCRQLGYKGVVLTTKG